MKRFNLRSTANCNMSTGVGGLEVFLLTNEANARVFFRMVNFWGLPFALVLNNARAWLFCALRRSGAACFSLWVKKLILLPA